MAGPKAHNKILKKAILSEVKEENRRLTHPDRHVRQFKGKEPVPGVVPKKQKTSRIVGLVTVSLVVLGFFILMLDSKNFSIIASRGPLESASTHNSMDPPLNPASAIVDADASLYKSHSGQPHKKETSITAGIAGVPWQIPSPADFVDVQNYDFLFNQRTIRLTTLFGLGVRTIVIDPGHGGKDPGAIGEGGTKEKEITLDVAKRLKTLLEKQSPFTIHLTRNSDSYVSLSQRVNFTNQVGADLFISIHVNAIPEPTINTIETYYFGPPTDEKTLALAEKENAASMYSAGDFKHLIQKIGNTMKHQESIALATHIQRRLFANIRKYDRDVHNWGVKVAPFMVLLDVEAPAVLTEISCISEPEEEKKLNTAEYRESIASFIEKGIIAYLGQKQVQAQRGDKDESKKNG